MRKNIGLSQLFSLAVTELWNVSWDSDTNKQIILLKNAKLNKQKSPALKLEIWRNQFHRSPRKWRDWLHLEITEAYNSSGSAICCHVANFTGRLSMDRERQRENIERCILFPQNYYIWEEKQARLESFQAKIVKKINGKSNIKYIACFLLNKVWIIINCEESDYTSVNNHKGIHLLTVI